MFLGRFPVGMPCLSNIEFALNKATKPLYYDRQTKGILIEL